MLQPSGFIQNFLTGVAGFTPDGALVDTYSGAGVSYIDAADIAACAAAVLREKIGRGATHILTGPESLTASDIALRLSRVVGRDVPVVSVSPEFLRKTLVGNGIPTRFADDIATLCADVATGALAETTDAVAAMTRNAPRSFSAFADAHANELRRAVDQ